MLPTLKNPVFAECLEGIAQRALEEGYGIMPIASGYDHDQEPKAIATLVSANVDGLILTVTDPEQCQSLLRQLQQDDVPYILAYNQSHEHPCVGVNSQVEVMRVVDRLVTVGHRRIAMLSGQLNSSDRARARYEGYIAGMSAAKLEPLPIVEVPFMRASDQMIAEMLAGPSHHPTAVICSNDLLALRFIRQAKYLGFCVPHDLSVVGFDGIAVAAEVSPALSTVVQPSVGIGRRAAELVIAQLRGEMITAGSEPPMPCSFREGETICRLAS